MILGAGQRMLVDFGNLLKAMNTFYENADLQIALCSFLK
jgi:hypothetical protein